MQIDVAEGRQVNHPLGNDASVADDEDGLGSKCSELGAEGVIVLDFFRLRERKAEIHCGLLYGRCGGFHAAAFGLIGLRHNQRNRIAGSHHCLQRGDCEERGSAVD